MKKIMLLLILAVSLLSCNNKTKESIASLPQETASILEFKGLHSQDSGTNIKSNTVVMGKRNINISYNEDFVLYESSEPTDTSTYEFKYLEEYFGYPSENVKYLGSKSDTLKTNIMVFETTGANDTKQALYDETKLNDLKLDVFNKVRNYGFYVKYAFRGIIQGNDAIIFSLYSDMNKLYGYVIIIIEDTETQLVVYGTTSNQNRLVDIEKTVSSMYIY